MSPLLFNANPKLWQLFHGVSAIFECPVVSGMIWAGKSHTVVKAQIL